MSRHELLARLHEQFEPRTYLEIGVSSGRSMALSRARSIGVDPAFHVTAPIACDVRLIRATSDEFFATADPVSLFDGMPVDLAFIDGMHLAEFAYRDFVNVERMCSRASVIVLDDMLPRTHDEAARARITKAWAGDVYKVGEILGRRRKDLTIVQVNTHPTGVVLVAGLDPGSTVLTDAYPEVLGELESPDPQIVPEHILDRGRAVDAAALMQLTVWERMRVLRDGDDSAAITRELGELAQLASS